MSAVGQKQTFNICKTAQQNRSEESALNIGAERRASAREHTSAGRAGRAGQHATGPMALLRL